MMKTQTIKSKDSKFHNTYTKKKFNHLVKEYKREQELEQKLQKLRILMSNTYVSDLIH